MDILHSNYCTVLIALKLAKRKVQTKRMDERFDGLWGIFSLPKNYWSKLMKIPYPQGVTCSFQVRVRYDTHYCYLQRADQAEKFVQDIKPNLVRFTVWGQSINDKSNCAWFTFTLFIVDHPHVVFGKSLSNNRIGVVWTCKRGPEGRFKVRG